MALKKWSDIKGTALQGNYDGYIQSSLLELRLSAQISNSSTNGLAVYNIKENSKYKIRLLVDSRFRLATCASIAMNTKMENYYRDAADLNNKTSANEYKETEITSRAGDIYLPVMYWASGSNSGKTWQAVYDTLEVYEELTGSLELTSPPSRLEYTAGDEISTEGMVLSAVWSDGSRETIESGYEVSGSTAEPGEQTVTVSYQGETVTFVITVDSGAPKATGLAVRKIKTEYLYGEEFDTTDMIVQVMYSDGHKEMAGEYTYSGYSATTMGQQNVVITSGGFTYTLPVTVKNAVSKIEVTPPTKTTYALGETFNTTGMVVTATWLDGSSGPVMDYTLAGIDTDIKGKQTGTVEYQGATATFTVTVNGVDSLIGAYENTTNGMTDLQYKINNNAVFPLAGNGIRINGKIVGGIKFIFTRYLKIVFLEKDTNEDIAYLYLYGSSSETNTPYMGKTYMQEGETGGIPFLKIRTKGTNAYLKGYEVEAFVFGNGDVHIISLTAASSFVKTLHSFNIVGGRSYELDGVSYQTMYCLDGLGKYQKLSPYAYIDGKISKNYYPLKEIKIITMPVKKVFFQGDEKKFDGMKIRAIDEGGQINDEPSYGFEQRTVDYTDEPGQQTVTVSLGKYSTSFTVNIIENAVESLRIEKIYDHYTSGTDLRGTLAKVTAIWGDGTQEEAETYEISGYDPEAIGMQEVLFLYEGCTEKKVLTIAESAALIIDMSDTKTEYLVGIEEFREPYKVILEFSDGYRDEIYSYNSLTTYTGFDNSVTGTNIITAEYRGFTAIYEVTVVDTVTVYIGAENPEDIVATLNAVTGILEITGTGETKVRDQPMGWDTIYGLFESEFGVRDNCIKKAVFSEGITNITNICCGMENLEEVLLPSTLTSIYSGDYYYTGFDGCTSLSKIEIPNQVTEISGFQNCTSLTELVLPESVSIIHELTFCECTGLELTIMNANVEIPNPYYTLQVKLLRGHLGSTTEDYASQLDIPFEPLETIVDIKVVKYPDRTFRIGEKLSKSELEVKAVFDDGGEIDFSRYDMQYDFSEKGEKTVTISYKELQKTFVVQVAAWKWEEIVNSSDGMEAVRYNKKNDDVTDTIKGVDWFKFDGKSADPIYVSGNNWIGFGTSSEQLKICRRDGAVWYLYRTESVLESGVKFLKIRVEGSTHYSSQTESRKLVYELFLFDNNDMYLNVITSPTESSYIGTSSLASNGKTATLNIPVSATANGPLGISFYHQDADGLDWEIDYKAYRFGLITDIYVKTLPKTRYAVGDPEDMSGLTITARYDDDTTEEIPAEECDISGFDSSTTGVKTITVAYKGFTTSFNVTVLAKYTVTFYDWDNKELKKVNVIEGEAAELPEEPSRKGYTFVGWDHPLESIQKDMDVYAVYQINVYTVTFNGMEGGTIETKEAEYGSSVEPPEAPAIRGYKFTGWDKDLTFIDADIVATAQYEELPVIGIRVEEYPEKTCYAVGEKLDTSGLVVIAFTSDGYEKKTENFTVTELDSGTSGNKRVTVTFTQDEQDTSHILPSGFDVKVTATGKDPFEQRKEGEKDPGPVKVTVHWINGEFGDLKNEDIAGPVVLQESICNERYFIFGGCVCNRVSFVTISKQFMGTGETDTPYGDIEVYVERDGTNVKIFTGTIDSGKRTGGLTAREIIAYDYLYRYRNIDIAWWYKNKTTDKQMILTQKQFRDDLMSYIGIMQEATGLYYDDALVPNTNQSNSMIVADILKDMCLQNSVFGWMNRDGVFRYMKLPENSKAKYSDNAGNITEYGYAGAQVKVDCYESCKFEEGRIWYPNVFYSEPDPRYWFSDGPPESAQDAYERNVFYNRNSFFVGNADWLDAAWQIDEYGSATVEEPIFKICYGPTRDPMRFYRAQEYELTVPGNPLNQVGDTIEITVRKTTEDGTKLEWTIHSYIMSRTLTILGDGSMTDVYSAKNSPYNGNSIQAGKNTSEIAAQVFQLRSESPVISYAEFTDGTSELAADEDEVKKTRLRCIKTLKEERYEELLKNGELRLDTLYFIEEEE